MNKRTAKRLAYHRAANVVDDAMNGGWPFNSDEFLDADGKVTADGCRIAAALKEVAAHLRRRGARYE